VLPKRRLGGISPGARRKRPVESANDARPHLGVESSFENNTLAIGLTRLAQILGQQAARETFSLLGKQSEPNCSPSDPESTKVRADR
jgi:hypothetical protein